MVDREPSGIAREGSKTVSSEFLVIIELSNIKEQLKEEVCLYLGNSI